MTINHDCRARQIAHDAIAKDLEKYLSSGGEIQRLGPGEMTRKGLEFHYSNSRLPELIEETA